MCVSCSCRAVLGAAGGRRRGTRDQEGPVAEPVAEPLAELPGREAVQRSHGDHRAALRRVHAVLSVHAGTVAALLTDREERGRNI